MALIGSKLIADLIIPAALVTFTLSSFSHATLIKWDSSTGIANAVF